MMADKISDLVKDIQCDRVALMGWSLNVAMVKILRSRFGQLDIPLCSALKLMVLLFGRWKMNALSFLKS